MFLNTKKQKEILNLSEPDLLCKDTYAQCVAFLLKIILKTLKTKSQHKAMSWFYVFKREKKETEILGLFISQQQGISWRDPGMEAVSRLRSYISEDVRPHLRSQRSYFRDQLTRISVQLRVWDKIILLFVYWTRGVLSFKHTCCHLQWSNFSDLFICIWKILLDLKKKWCKFDPWNDKVSVNDCLKMIFNVQILLIFLLWCYPQDQ